MAHGINNHFNKRKFNKYIEQELYENNYEPYGSSELTVSYADEMMKKIDIIKAMWQNGGKRGKIAGFKKLEGEHGKTYTKSREIYLSLTSDFVKTNFGMAITIYHELMHVAFDWNPSYRSIMLKYSNEDYEHYIIHKHINAVL